MVLVESPEAQATRDRYVSADRAAQRERLARLRQPVQNGTGQTAHKPRTS